MPMTTIGMMIVVAFDRWGHIGWLLPVAPSLSASTPDSTADSIPLLIYSYTTGTSIASRSFVLRPRNTFRRTTSTRATRTEFLWHLFERGSSFRAELFMFRG
jgi:hypothetical protein